MALDGSRAVPLRLVAGRLISENPTNKMHFYAAQLDAPEAFQPEGHAFKANRLSWLHLADDLPDLTGGKWS